MHVIRGARISGPLLSLLALVAVVQAGPFDWLKGKLEKEVQSEYSHIRIRRDGNVRSRCCSCGTTDRK